MDRAEELLLAVMPTLDARHIGALPPAEVEKLSEMVKEYARQVRIAERKSGKVSVASPSLSSGDDGDTGQEEEAEAFADAVAEVENCLNRVRDYLKRRLPFGTVPEPTTVPGAAAAPAALTLTSSTIASRKRSRNLGGEERPADTDRSSTSGKAPVYALDAFLYTEEDIEELVRGKKVARQYCLCCGSTDVGLTDFITHSFSLKQLVYLSCFLFTYLVELIGDASGTAGAVGDTAAGSLPLSIVDVGSRLGIVLWASAFALQRGLLAAPEVEVKGGQVEKEPAPMRAVQLIGVEMDPAFVRVSHDVMRRFFRPRGRHAPKMSTGPKTSAALSSEDNMVDVSQQLEVLQCSCFEGAGAAALKRSSIVVLHNVFEYFCDSPVEHARCWLKLQCLVSRTGQYLVCSPPLEVTLNAFTADVWSKACALEDVDKGDGDDVCTPGLARSATTSPQEWLAGYVEPTIIDDVIAHFLTLNAPSQEGNDESDSAEEQDAHHHDHAYGKCSCHGTCSPGLSQPTEEEDEMSDEVEEQIRNIAVYRVR